MKYNMINDHKSIYIYLKTVDILGISVLSDPKNHFETIKNKTIHSDKVFFDLN